MPSAQGIRAGKAFIELTLKDVGLAKGLAAAEAKLKGIGDSLVGIGKKIGAVGLAGAAAFVPMVKAAAQANDQFGKFESVFGPLTDEVARFAKELSDAMGRSEQSIIKFLATAQGMFVTFGFDQQAASNISKTLAQLTIDMAEFHDVSEEEVFEGLTKAMLGSARALKQYGVNLSEAAVDQQLLNEGLKPDLASEQQKVLARLAIVMRSTAKEQGEAVRSAKEFDSQFTRTKGIIQDTAVAIGRALLPSLGQIFGAINKNLAIAKDWVSENENLVRIVAAGTVAVTALGAATITLGIAFLGVSKALAGLRLGLGVVVGSFNALLGVIPALANPVVLLTVAVTALAVAIAVKLGAATKVFDFIKEKFGELSREVSVSIQAMGDALAQGDIAAAAKVLWTGLKLEWTKGIAFLNTAWVAFKATFLSIWTDAVYGLAQTFVRGIAGLQTAWIQLRDFFLDTWAVVTTGITTAWLKAQQVIAQGIIKLGGMLNSEFDVEGAIRELNTDFERKRTEVTGARDKGLQEREEARRRDLDAIEANKGAAIEGVEAERQRRQTELRENEVRGLEKLQQEMNQARDEWANAIRAAAAARKKAGEELGKDDALAKFQAQLAQAIEGVDVATKASPSTAAQFGGQRAEQIFGVQDNIAKRQLVVQERMLLEQERTRKAVENGGLAFI